MDLILFKEVKQIDYFVTKRVKIHVLKSVIIFLKVNN